MSVNDISPHIDIAKVKELLKSGATFDHFIPKNNADINTWHVVNAFSLAIKSNNVELIDTIFGYCNTWNYSHTITRYDLFTNIQIKSFLRAAYGTPLGLSFVHQLTRHWQRIIKEKVCPNPVLDFIYFSRYDNTETKYEQLQAISDHYNFANVLKSDLKLLSEFKEFQSTPYTISPPILNNLRCIYKFISNQQSPESFENIIGKSYKFNNPITWRYLTNVCGKEIQQWLVSPIMDHPAVTSGKVLITKDALNTITVIIKTL